MNFTVFLASNTIILLHGTKLNKFVQTQFHCRCKTRCVLLGGTNIYIYIYIYIYIHNILLTVHPNIKVLFFTNLMHKILYFNTFITFLYMFRALLCSSSGGQIVLVQPLVSSPSLGNFTVHRLRKDYSPLLTCVLNSHLKRVTIPEAVQIQFYLLRMSLIVRETCRGM